MIPRIRYDFSDLRNVISRIKQSDGRVKQSDLNTLRDELNHFFKDSRCKEVIYTANTDKMFFGMAVVPVLTGNDAVTILQTNETFRIKEYYLELDSKIFDPGLGLSSDEILACVLHEIGHIVNDGTPADEVRRSVDIYLAQNNEVLRISDSVHYREILAYAIKDTMRKVTSMFEKDDEEILADEFVAACGYGDALESAFNRICRNSMSLNKQVTNKLIVLSWTLRLYKDVKLRRIPALRALKKGQTLIASKLEKREMDNVARRLNRIDDSTLMESVIDDARVKARAAIKKAKFKGLRDFEDDLYEYKMRVRNIDDEYEMLEILRNVNTRISIIDDYLFSEEIGASERKRWSDLLDKYRALREIIGNKVTYRNRKQAIYVEYPEIVSNRW